VILLLAQIPAAISSDTTVTVGLVISIIGMAVAAGRQQQRINYLEEMWKQARASTESLMANHNVLDRRMVGLEIVLGELKTMARETREDVRRIRDSGSYPVKESA
jgi:hypothetical protein